MAKLECNLRGSMSEIIKAIDDTVVGSSMSAKREDKSDFSINGVHCAIRVYERYSMMGGNRVSLNITIVGNDEESFLSAITSGGSQAVLFKINTLGEEAFLDTIRGVVRRYARR